MSGEPTRELSWAVWPAGVGYKKFAIDVDERHMFIVEMVADDARLLGDALSQADAAAEARGRQWAVDRLRAEAERINPSGGSPVGVSNTTMWAVCVAAADLLEFAMKEESGDGAD